MIVVGILLAYALPLLRPPIITTPDSDFGGRAVRRSASYALVALGLNIVIGYAGLLDLGYVGFYAVGAYTDGRAHVRALALAVLPGPARAPIAVTMVTGVILGAPTLRVRGDYLAIVTLGFGEIIRIIDAEHPAGWAQRPASRTSRRRRASGPTRSAPTSDGLFQIPHLDVERADPAASTHEHKTPFLVFGVLDAVPYYWLLLTVLADRAVRRHPDQGEPGRPRLGGHP